MAHSGADCARQRVVVEFLFQGLGIERTAGDAKVVGASIVSWNYTTFLNILFLLLTGAFVLRFVRTGRLPLLRMLDEPMTEHADDQAHGAHA